MSNMSKLHVQVAAWNNYEQGYESVGTVIYDNDPNHRLGFTGFVYDRDYIAKGGAALDPVNLKTTENEGRFVFSMDGKLPSYFAEFLPGTVTDQLIAKQDSRWQGLNQAEKLFLLTEINGDFGAIQLNSHLDQFDRPIDRLGDLKAIVDVIKDFQADRSTPTLSKEALRTLTAFGGTGPKVDFELTQNGKAERYVVKLNATSESNDAVVSQFMGSLQSSAGINRVPSNRAELPGGDDVLLSKNYARGHGPSIDADSPASVLRHNTVSLATLLSQSSHLGNADVPTYMHAAKVIKEVSADPKADLEELMRRAVFSALTSHTSNGLDNIEMYDVGGGNWRLGPSFNNLPSMSPVAPFELSFTGLKDTVNFLKVDAAMVAELGNAIGLDEGLALRIAQPVAATLAHVNAEMNNFDVPAREQARIASAIGSDAAFRLQADIVMQPAYQADVNSLSKETPRSDVSGSGPSAGGSGPSM